MKKVIYLIVVLILIGVGFYLWKNRDKYFFQGEVPYEIHDEEKNRDQENGDLIRDGNRDDQENNDDDSETTETIDGATSGENDELLDILQNHCGNKCEGKKNTSDYNYCLEICGLNASSSEASDCGSLSASFEKDVCYKNQAIKEKNSGICNSISDVRLKESCKDRVIEELFE